MTFRAAPRLATLALALAMAACGSTSSSPSPSADGACESYRAIYVASDYTSSAVGALALDGSTPHISRGSDLGVDPALSFSAGRAFYVARREDAIFELDAKCGAPIAKWSVAEASHKGSSNPQDVAVANDGSLWVARYNVPTIAILPSGGGAMRTIDLAKYDADGNPNASAIRTFGAKAFVMLQRLDDADRLLSKQPSKVLRIDTTTTTIEAEIDLEGRNPFAVFDHAGVLWLSEPGNFGASDEPFAGVETLDLATSTSKLVVHERDLGGSVAEVAVVDGCAAAIIADATPENATSLVTFDPSTGTVLRDKSRAWLSTPGFSLQALAWITDANGARVLLVGDRGARGSAGYVVHAFDVSGACELAARRDAIFLPQKPVAIRARP